MTFEPHPAPAPRNFYRQVVGAALLNGGTFRDVHSDSTATVKVYGLVAAAAIASVIGSIDDPRRAAGIVLLLVSSWLIYAHVAWFMRSYLYDSIHAEAARSEMLRVVGIAYGPALIFALGGIPGIGEVARVAPVIWMAVAIVVGFKSALAFGSYFPALGIFALSTLLIWILSGVIFAIF